MDGWIKLHRKVRNNYVFNDHQLFRLWIICLTEAYHKPHIQPVGKQMVNLDVGQFVTGRYALHALYIRGLSQKEIVSEKTVWRWLEKLEIGEFLSVDSTNKFSIVTVLNWHLYQTNDQQNDQQMTNKRPTDDQQMTTNKNVKNVKNEENDKKKRIYSLDSTEYMMADYLHRRIMIHAIDSGVSHLVNKANLQSWADDCRKLLEIDKLDRELIRDVIDWATSHDFWKTNILSASKLRSKFKDLALKMSLEKKKTAELPKDKLPTSRTRSGKPILPMHETVTKIMTYEEYLELANVTAQVDKTELASESEIRKKYDEYIRSESGELSREEAEAIKIKMRNFGKGIANV